MSNSDTNADPDSSYESSTGARPAVHVYDSRENCVRSPADGTRLPADRQTAVSRLFAAEAPIAFDGEWLYLAVRVSDGTSRSQTCYAVVDATKTNSLRDLEAYVSAAFDGTQLRVVPADRDQLAYVCGFLGRYDAVLPPDEFDLLVSASESTRCGVPSYEVALAAFEYALSAGEPLVVSRRAAYLEDGVDAPLGAKNVVIIDERLESVTLSDENEALVDRLRTAHRERSIEQAVEPVDGVVADLRQLGMDDETIRERVTDRLPASGESRNGDRSTGIGLGLPSLGGLRDGRGTNDSRGNGSSTDSLEESEIGPKTNGSAAGDGRFGTPTNDGGATDSSSSTTSSAGGPGNVEPMTEKLPGVSGSSGMLVGRFGLAAFTLIGLTVAGIGAGVVALSWGYGPTSLGAVPTAVPSLPAVTPSITLLALALLTTLLFVGIVLAKR